MLGGVIVSIWSCGDRGGFEKGLLGMDCEMEGKAQENVVGKWAGLEQGFRAGTRHLTY